MTTRRSFLSTLAAGAAAAALPRASARAASKKPPLGLQLYSVRNQLKTDVPGTLKQVRAWGIEEVEGFGQYGAPIAGALKDAGLRMTSIHVGYEDLQKDIDAVLKDADVLGVKTIVNPYLPHQQRPSASREEILRAASDFAKWSKLCRAAGKRFGYHIHGQEFGRTEDGGVLFDVLAKESGPDVGFEADVFWVTIAGADPVELMGRYPGRFWFTHLKDMKPGTVRGEGVRYGEANVVLGTGALDVKAIVAAGIKAGVEINYIEDESSSVMTQVPQSVAYYNSLTL